MKPALYLLLLTLLLSACNQAKDVSTPLKRTTECMLKVLNEMPGVSEPTLGETTIGGENRPFIEYRATEDAHWKEPTRFTFQKSSDGHFVFMTTLPGLTTPGSDVDSRITDAVVKKWKTHCSVEAVAFFV